MCGRFSLTDPLGIGLRFDLLLPEEDVLAAHFNIAPSQLLPVVVAEPQGRALRWMRWGFQPPWLKEPARQAPPINARAETLLERRMFSGSLARHRCLIPADGFFEWRTLPGQRAKQPLYIRLKDKGMFAFAGLYTDGPGGANDETTASCVIITTAANDFMRPIHARMPVILSRADESRWIDASITDPGAVLDCLQAYPSEQMEAYAVSQRVSSARNEGAELLLPV